MKEKKKISGGSAIAGQAMILLFSIPFLGLLLNLMLENEISQEGLIFILIFFLLISGIILLGFRFSDVYIRNEELIALKLFYRKKYWISEVDKVEKGLFPFSCFIYLKSGKKIFFFSQTETIVKSLFSNESDYTIEKTNEYLGIN
ncbi:MAG: hypothetical protein ACWA6U_17790 [Breznakibacter sp.]